MVPSFLVHSRKSISGKMPCHYIQTLLPISFIIETTVSFHMICFRYSFSSSSRSLLPKNCLNSQFKNLTKPKTPVFLNIPCFYSTIMMTNFPHSTKPAPSAGYDPVPGFSVDEMDRISEQMMQRYSLNSMPMKRNGKGVAIVWFRNDLRVLDNEALFRAWRESEVVLPVYCVDPRIFGGTTHYFGFPKTGALRALFLIECLDDLKKKLIQLGLNLLIQVGKPEDILPSLGRKYEAHTVYAHKETCSEELNVEKLVRKSLRQVVLTSPTGNQSSINSTKLELIWGSTMYHVDDLPFDCNRLPDVYTQFRKSVESKSEVRSCIKIPTTLGPPPDVEDWGCVPSIDHLGVPQGNIQVSKGMKFVGGESAALTRVHEYFWKKDLLRIYKHTRNGMLGPDYSTKFSPWLAAGSLSPRLIYEEVKRYEKERHSNDSTYWKKFRIPVEVGEVKTREWREYILNPCSWNSLQELGVLFELIWRDYFKFISIKYGNSLFHPGGPRKVEVPWSQNQSLFEAWRDGCTGYPLIDANMKELSTTGFMSNRGRQIVCSFLVRDMGIDWRMGAEWFETCLLDYDPSSNYGNWTYGAGVGNDPREDRYFSIPKQAKNYDPEGEYVAYWLMELQSLPNDKRNFPGNSYIKTVVPLKYGNTNKSGGMTESSGRKQGEQSRRKPIERFRR